MNWDVVRHQEAPRAQGAAQPRRYFDAAGALYGLLMRGSSGRLTIRGAGRAKCEARGQGPVVPVQDLEQPVGASVRGLLAARDPLSDLLFCIRTTVGRVVRGNRPTRKPA